MERRTDRFPEESRDMFWVLKDFSNNKGYKFHYLNKILIEAETNSLR
jgi:hypothetical protein